MNENGFEDSDKGKQAGVVTMMGAKLLRID